MAVVKARVGDDEIGQEGRGDGRSRAGGFGRTGMGPPRLYPDPLLLVRVHRNAYPGASCSAHRSVVDGVVI